MSLFHQFRQFRVTHFWLCYWRRRPLARCPMKRSDGGSNACSSSSARDVGRVQRSVRHISGGGGKRRNHFCILSSRSQPSDSRRSAGLCKSSSSSRGISIWVRRAATVLRFSARMPRTAGVRWMGTAAGSLAARTAAVYASAWGRVLCCPMGKRCSENSGTVFIFPRRP